MNNDSTKATAGAAGYKKNREKQYREHVGNVECSLLCTYHKCSK